MVSSNFKKLIDNFGFKIQKVAFRPEILSVQYMNVHLFTIPRIMYSHDSQQHRDMAGNVHPSYYDLEQKAIAWNMKVKRSDFLEEQWEMDNHFKKLYE